MKKIILLIFIISFAKLSAQENVINAGPMPGYSEMKESVIWLQTTGPALVFMQYWVKGNKEYAFYSNKIKTTKEDAFTAHLIADMVIPGQTYQYQLFVNNQPWQTDKQLEFVTQELWQYRKDPPNFKFAIGSCAFMTDSLYDRPGKPYGGDYQIFNKIADRNPDFMIWLGDNLYYREVDYYSKTGMLDRYTKDRSHPAFNKLLTSTHHYAIWDDHDYGPNNSDGTYRNKGLSVDIFNKFWANPKLYNPDLESITTKFIWADVEFFLLDDRYYRTPNWSDSPEKSILGVKQREWLINSLISSRAPFKIVCVGNQFLHPSGSNENFSYFKADRDAILESIDKEGIDGVIFFTGDRHFTELTKLERPGKYPLYDLTCSPFTSGSYSNGCAEENKFRVEGTCFTERNFAIIEVTGKFKKRSISFTVIDNEGNEVWSKSFTEQELSD